MSEKNRIIYSKLYVYIYYSKIIFFCFGITIFFDIHIHILNISQNVFIKTTFSCKARDYVIKEQK